MFFGDDDEGGDFLASSGGGRSRLQSLFGEEPSSSSSGNESLKYTAPKQPKAKGEPKVKGSATAPAPEIMLAVAAHVYKYVDNKYASQGNLGVAVLATHSTNSYKLLVYASKQQQVTYATITQAFTFTIQNENYASFHDDTRNTWSLMFTVTDTLVNFAKQVVLARALSAGPSLSTVVSLDLNSGEGGALETGDSAEVTYTGWLLTDNKYGQVFDSNVSSGKSFRLRLGKGKVIKGWDEGIVGMKKNGKRLLVIPASMAYGPSGMGDKIPPISTLIFQIEVTRVKLAKGDPDPSVTPPMDSSSVDTDQTDEEQTVKARSRSFTDMKNKPVKSDKARLISRMAKMGQPMLPSLGGAVVATETSDDEDTVSPESPPQRPTISPRPSQHRLSASNVIVNQPVNQPVSQPINQPVNQPVSQPVSQVVNQPQPTVIPQQVQQPQVIQQPQMQAQMVQPQVTQMPQQPIIADPQYTAYAPMQEPMAQPQPLPSFVQNHPTMQQLSLYQPPQANPLLQPQAGLGSFNTFAPQQYPSSAFPANNAPAPAPAPAPPPPSDSLTPVFVSETRQQNTEVRLALSKMADKVDRALEKLENLQSNSTNTMSLSNTMTSMEAGILMHNIQRIVQENERVKKELFDQSSHIETQNQKISELLQRNQRSVQQSHTFLEQSNDSFQATATQAQAKVLSLEQEKCVGWQSQDNKDCVEDSMFYYGVSFSLMDLFCAKDFTTSQDDNQLRVQVQLTTELSGLNSQLGTVMVEVSGLRRSEATVKHQLEETEEAAVKLRNENSLVKASLSDTEKKVAELTTQLKEEKQLRKSGDNNLVTLTEEMDDLKSAKMALEKNLKERKNKHKEERERMEEEGEEMKRTYEQEIKELQNKCKQLRQHTDAASSQQVSIIEAELDETWSLKLEKSLKFADDKHQREISDVKSELGEKDSVISELEEKLAAMKSSSGDHTQNVILLQTQVEQLSGWKDKYDGLRSTAGAMKERYEARITELMGSEQFVEELRAQLKVAEREVERLKVEKSNIVEAAPVQSAPTVPESSADIKRVMNSVFQSAKSSFVADQSYQGSEVIQALLNTIKAETLKLISKETPTQQSTETDDEDTESETESESEDMTEDDVDEIADELNDSDISETEEAVIPPSEGKMIGNDDGNPEILAQIDASFAVQDEILQSGGEKVTDNNIPDNQTNPVDETAQNETETKLTDNVKQDDVHESDINGIVLPVSESYDEEIKENVLQSTDLSTTKLIVKTDILSDSNNSSDTEDDISNKIDSKTNIVNENESNKINTDIIDNKNLKIYDDSDVDDDNEIKNINIKIDDKLEKNVDIPPTNNENQIITDLPDFTDETKNHTEITETESIDDLSKSSSLHQNGDVKNNDILPSSVLDDNYTSDDTEYKSIENDKEQENVRNNLVENHSDEIKYESKEKDLGDTVLTTETEKVEAKKDSLPAGKIQSKFVTTRKSRTPPPFDDNSISVLDDDDDPFEDAIEETFGSMFKPKPHDSESLTDKDSKDKAKGVDTKGLTKVDLTDDDFKDKPPPLFGDDDDDDLDWLS